MAGHSKWAQIKRKKAITDGARSKVFSKYARLITVESKRAKGDVNDHQLRAVIDRAKAENMPKEAIERAVAKGTSADGAALESITYETYGPGGVAVLIDTLTDSRNRTVAEIKHLLATLGYDLAVPGSALWAFTRTHSGYVPHTFVPISEKEAIALTTLLDALGEHEDVQELYTNAEDTGTS